MSNDLKKFMNTIYSIFQNRPSPYVFFLNSYKQGKEFFKNKKTLKQVSDTYNYNKIDNALNLNQNPCHSIDSKTR